jgi:hypothetical protein
MCKREGEGVEQQSQGPTLLRMGLRRDCPAPLPLPHDITKHAMAATLNNGDASHAPIEVSFPLPKAPHTNIHLQLTDNGPNLLLFLTSASPESPSASLLGSFVYAMPNVSLSPPC